MTRALAVLAIATALASSAFAEILDNCNTQARYALLQTPISFDSASATLRSDAYAILQRLTEIALECPDSQLAVGGHTDSRGDTQSNLALSERRARAVASALAELGIATHRIRAQGFGGSQPVADNDTRKGRRLNRRITVSFSAADRPPAN